MKISECITLLQDIYNSIDIRAAVYKKDAKWFAAFLILRFRKEKVEDVKDEQKKIFEKYGKIDEENFKIVFDVLDIERWSSILESWNTKSITIKNNFVINLNRRDFMEPNMNEPYSHANFALIDDNWISYHNALNDNDGNLTNSISITHTPKAREFLSRDIAEYFEKIFQVSNYHTQNLRTYMIIAPVFFKIDKIEFTLDKVEISCTGFPEDEIDFIMNFQKQGGANPITFDAIHINHKISGEENKETKFTISENLKSNHMEHLFRLDVYRKNGVLLDSEKGSVSDKFPTKGEFTNPLFETFKIFVTPAEFRKILLNLESNDIKSPDKVFERGITWLLSLIGCTPVNLQGYERSGQEPDKVSMDIIASYSDEIIYKK